MRKRRVISLFVIMMLCFGITASAKPEENRDSMFMGEVIEVKKDGDKTSLLVEGYLKGCEIYKEKLLVNVTGETRIKLSCDEAGMKEHKEECKKEENNQNTKEDKKQDVKEEKKQDNKNNKDNKDKGNSAQEVKIEFSKGDAVFMVLDKAMTKSIPPQVNAKFIKVTKVR